MPKYTVELASVSWLSEAEDPDSTELEVYGICELKYGDQTSGWYRDADNHVGVPVVKYSEGGNFVGRQDGKLDLSTAGGAPRITFTTAPGSNPSINWKIDLKDQDPPGNADDGLGWGNGTIQLSNFRTLTDGVTGAAQKLTDTMGMSRPKGNIQHAHNVKLDGPGGRVTANFYLTKNSD